MTALVRPDVLRLHCRRCEHHRRRRDAQIVGAVVLADTEHLETHLIRELDLLHEIAQPLLRGDRLTRYRMSCDVGKSVETDFHLVSES